MFSKKLILPVLAAIILFGGCTNTRYLTDPTSIGRQKDMKSNRVGKNVGEGCLNMTLFIIAGIFNFDFEPIESERAFKKISIINESTDTLFVNMVTDVVWKEAGYCDVMGIVLPPTAKQKLLLPYPAAYNVYFQTPFTEEEKLEVRTDSKLRRIRLRAGMTVFDIE
ncbi:MAG: hypothetical protein Q8P34_03065 [Bacteroidota bacterium]|nr:hypothetical protein [Bacteroidota bacterium]